MNYIEHEEDPVDIPRGFSRDDLFPINPYEQGMHDYWYEENNWWRIFDDEAMKLYQAGRRNAEIILMTLRSKF